jgi:hypothetical protein
MSTLPTVPINPFRPGNGQRPVYLAGRTKEQDTFTQMVRETLPQNAIVTGLRGVGKTVLLEELKPIAQSNGWLWTGNDLSESASLTEDRIARRIVLDLSTLLAPIVIQTEQKNPMGFTNSATSTTRPLTFDDLWKTYEGSPGLATDKLKAVFSQVLRMLESQTNIKGIIFAYDEAQNLSDHALAREFPVSVLLDVFSYFQRQSSRCQFRLVLTGLPTLFPKLNEARTYTERMFHVMHLQRLEDVDARQAVIKPIEITKSRLRFSPKAIEDIVSLSDGYPYFIQFLCKEVFDAWIGKITVGEAPSVPMDNIIEKLDQDFFAPRWARATDRQQDFMKVVSTLPNAEDEFSVNEIVAASKSLLKKGFTPSHATQILQALAEKGLMYRNRRGGYCFAVPLLSRFIDRQSWGAQSLLCEE